MIDGEIPRREGGHWADGFFHHQLIHALSARRDYTPVGAAAFLGEPFNDVSTGHDFEFGFAHWLALLQRHQFSDAISALTKNSRSFAHDFRALVGRHFAPDFEALIGGVKRAIQISFFGVGHGADVRMRGGVDHRQGAARRSGAPYAVDE